MSKHYNAETGSKLTRKAALGYAKLFIRIGGE
jgi:hypothetical protein